MKLRHPSWPDVQFITREGASLWLDNSGAPFSFEDLDEREVFALEEYLEPEKRELTREQILGASINNIDDQLELQNKKLTAEAQALVDAANKCVEDHDLQFEDANGSLENLENSLARWNKFRGEK